MRLKPTTLPLLPSAVLLGILLGLVEYSHSIAVISIDLGSEWMKMGIVSPGVPMEIVLNKESKRKTPIAISFRNGERLIGEDALNIAVRFPPNAYIYFMDLLGKKLDNPIVQLYQKRFPHYKLVADPDRGTVLFQHDNDTHYSPEELLGMMINQARLYAQEFASQPVKDVVITIPPYFNQAERRAVMHAAAFADVKVLQLMNSNTASALNYGIFRSSSFNESAQYLLLYDMGASSTVATIVKYQVTKTKERGITETHPQLTILGVGYDRTLGGLEKQIRLRDYLGQAFNEQKKTKTDIFTNHRALAKLFKEAGRLKTVLSANVDHHAQIEGLIDEKDFKFGVNREKFESLCSDLFDRVNIPIEQAMKAAGLTIDLIDQVILVGAGTRVPKVQEKLAQALKRELGKSLNTDEAAAMGAAYKAAELSAGFKVKKFITKDAVIFPILVDFERELDSEDGSPKTVKVVRRTLFSHMNPYPQKKILTFNKHVDDFTFYVSYGDLPIPVHEANALGTTNITKVDLKGVGQALKKNNAEDIESKGVKAHFHLDESGIFSLTLVESVFEKNETVSETVAESGDTLSKLGSAFSKLFSGNAEDDPSKSNGGDTGNEEPTEAKSATSNSDQEKLVNETEGKPPTEEATKPADAKQDDTPKSDGKPAEKNATSEIKKPKIVTIKEPIEVETYILDVLPLEGERLKTSTQKLRELNEIDLARSMREKARNHLESFVSDIQHKVFSSDFEQFVADDEKESIGTFCSETSDWLYEDGSEAERDVYEDKLKALKLLTKDFLERLREHKDRPDALEGLDKMLNISNTFLQASKGVPEDLQYFTEVELTTLEKAVKETEEWKEKQLLEQAATPLHKPPVLTIRSIAEKLDTLDREVKYMMNKARVEKLKKQREEAAAKIKEKEDKAKADAAKEAAKPGAAEVPPPEDEGTPTDETAGKEAKEEVPPSASKAEEKPDPTPTTEEPTHTEL